MGDQRKIYAIIGELILVASTADHCLNRITIHLFVFHGSPYAHPVISILDASRKIELIKSRTEIIPDSDFNIEMKDVIRDIEYIYKMRNIACHSTLTYAESGHEDDDYLVSLQATKVFKAHRKKHLDKGRFIKGGTGINELQRAIDLNDTVVNLTNNLVNAMAKWNKELVEARSDPSKSYNNVEI